MKRRTYRHLLAPTDGSRAAQRALDAVKALAKAAGVRCGAESARDDKPSRAMLGVARKRGCDLIVLAPRGPGGLRVVR